MLASLALIMIVGITVAGVFMRYVMGEPLKWTEEATLALIVWFTFLGSSAAFRGDGHVSIGFFVDRLNKKLQRWVMIVWHLVLIVILLYVFIWLGFELAMQAGDKLTPILRISYTFIDLSVVLCGVFAVARLAIGLRNVLKGGE
ncbi:TRAP transporter small permease [Paenibacillus sp.]|uniref:TRAP transporter small permease n=1 Tax=Paenibacillus sp. TaxID=58172 RepID=UPI002D662078|nr:TRAP transporter small permease [Paenibacillus sp.]HZG87473.1 TRAP transporter small permease [Paenibacillus sp.]